MYLTMPMSAQALPVMGTCAVNDKKISLRFPLTNVSFDLPESPKEGSTTDMEFKMSGARGYQIYSINRLESIYFIIYYNIFIL